MRVQWKKKACREIALMAVFGLIVVCSAITTLSAPARAAEAMTANERVVIEDDIRQQIALYGLLADGDGISKADTAALVKKIYAPNIVSEVYRYVDQPPIRIEGRDAILKATAPRDDRIARRHFFVSTFFDEVTPTTAKTRTSVLEVQLTRNMIGHDCVEKYGEKNCGGQFFFGEIIVYHEEWAKTPEGWQKTLTVLRRLS